PKLRNPAESRVSHFLCRTSTLCLCCSCGPAAQGPRANKIRNHYTTDFPDRNKKIYNSPPINPLISSHCANICPSHSSNEVLPMVLLLLAACLAWLLPATPEQKDGYPAVSNDGKHIAFISTRTGAEEVFVISPDGTGEKQLTSTKEGKNAPYWNRQGL